MRTRKPMLEGMRGLRGREAGGSPRLVHQLQARRGARLQMAHVHAAQMLGAVIQRRRYSMCAGYRMRQDNGAHGGGYPPGAAGRKAGGRGRGAAPASKDMSNITYITTVTAHRQTTRALFSD